MRDDKVSFGSVFDEDLELLDRERLIRRWRCGSDSFFWRAEAKGLLMPRRLDGLLRYAWPDIFAFEGGQPPEGFEAEYRHNLLTATEVAAFCGCSETKVVREAKAGQLAVRRIGRALRFVPAEVGRWQKARWRYRNQPPSIAWSTRDDTASADTNRSASGHEA
jgi:predicted DNA-binding transcriptional regulator AlpA